MSSSNYTCKSCDKKYTQKSSYQNHSILCDFLKISKRETQIEGEETTDLPNYKDLVKLVGILAIKNNKLEEKIETMQKLVNKTKKKINVIEWLNSTIKPEQSLLQFLSTIVISETHINYLNENNMIKTLTLIFEQYFNKEALLPIYAIKEKQNIFYSYDDSTQTWQEMDKAAFVSMLYYIDRIVQTEITNWSRKYAQKIKYNDKIAEIFNKLIGKANLLSYRDEVTLGRLKSILFNLLKCEIKRYVEYEFEY